MHPVSTIDLCVWLALLGAGLIFLPKDRLRILFLTLLFVVGYALVATVLWGRPSPFLARGGNYGNIFQLLATAVLIAPLACRATLGKLDVFVDFKKRRVWGYGLIFIVACFFGLLSRIKVIDFSLKSADLAKAPWFFYLVAGCALLAFIYAFIRQIRDMRGKVNLPIYFTGIGAFLLLITLATFILRDTHYLHIHHYTWALFLVFIFRFDHPFSRTVQPLALGIYLDGIASWGFDPWWYLLGG